MGMPMLCEKSTPNMKPIRSAKCEKFQQVVGPRNVNNYVG